MFNVVKRQDARAVRRVLKGATDAFGELVERYLPAVQAVAHANLGNPVDADDVAQESFLQAYRSLDTLREARKFEGWLIAIVRNKCYELLRVRAREAKAREGLAQRVSGETVSDAAREEIRRLVHDRVQSLDAPHREVLLLHYFAGKRTAEIAEALGISRDAVKKRLERARTVLGRELVRDLGDLYGIERSQEKVGGAILAAVAATPAAWSSAGLPLHALTWFRGVMGYSIAVIVVVTGGASAFLLIPHGGADGASDADAVTVPRVAAERPQSVSVPPQPAEVRAEEAATQTGRKTARPVSAAAVTIPPMSEDLAATLRKRLVLNFENIHVSPILDFLTGHGNGPGANLNFVLDYAVVPPKPPHLEAVGDTLGAQWAGNQALLPANPPNYVTDGMVEHIQSGKDETFMQTLEKLLYPRHLDFVLEPGFVWVSTPERIGKEVKAWPAERYDAYGLDKILDSPSHIEFENEHLDAILDFLSEYTDLSIVSDYRVIAPRSGTTGERKKGPRYSYVTDGIVPYISVQRIELRDALTALLRPLNLDYTIANGLIWVSSPQRLKGGLLVPHTTMDTAPDPSVSFEMEDSTLMAALSFLAKETGQQFYVEDRTFSTPYIPWNPSIPVVEAPVVQLTITPGTLGQVLCALLWPQGLDYTYYDGHFWIGTVRTISHREINTHRFKSLSEFASTKQKLQDAP